jgi:hypothetical protein
MQYRAFVHDYAISVCTSQQRRLLSAKNACSATALAIGKQKGAWLLLSTQHPHTDVW